MKQRIIKYMRGKKINSHKQIFQQLFLNYQQNKQKKQGGELDKHQLI